MCQLNICPVNFTQVDMSQVHISQEDVSQVDISQVNIPGECVKLFGRLMEMSRSHSLNTLFPTLVTIVGV